ncbi:response regulator [Paenibacillus pinihumi]|uniref:response regulator n=1 Tax=Paenibacillus pinihumi TaxID=669462 RepID=UPI0004082CAC|nr:response regulator transcription factor [Paenibacillus pinihumi]
MQKNEKSRYRLIVADDQLPTREGLKLILEYEGDMEVVGLAKNGLEAYDLARAFMPDLVLMDVQMPIMDGISALKRIKAEFPQIQVMILTTFIEDEYIIEGLAGGASGYILKDMEGDKLMASVRDAAAGRFMLQGVVAEKLAFRLRQLEQKAAMAAELQPSLPRLTEREEEVARLMVKGLNNNEIGKQLNISDGTVRNYISGLYGKLNVGSRAEAIVKLLQASY